METETLGKYKIHLNAIEVAAPVGWDGYVTASEFSEEAQDFVPVLDRFPVPGGPFADYASAIDAGRKLANTLLENVALRRN